MKIKKIVKSISSGKFKFPALLFVAIEKVFSYHRDTFAKKKKIQKKRKREWKPIMMH